MNVEELMSKLEKYPKDLKVCFLLQLKESTGLYYDIQCHGLKMDDEKLVYIGCKDFEEDFEHIKEGESPYE